jgi:hypothetical protein
MRAGLLLRQFTLTSSLAVRVVDSSGVMSSVMPATVLWGRSSELND